MNNDTLSKLRQSGYIIKLQGKEFVLFSGLQVMARTMGLKSIKTEMITINHETGLIIFRAEVDGDKGFYVSHGDASPKNVSRNIAPHLIRMAETRAIARALRLYCAVGMTSVEELGGPQ